MGDSKVYLIRKGKIIQLSTDHTQAERLIRLGILTQESAIGHSSKHQLHRYFGVSPLEGVLEADISDTVDIEKNDIFLICSDGLTDMIEERKILEILQSERQIEQLNTSLVDEALERGGNDNVTSILIKIERQ